MKRQSTINRLKNYYVNLKIPGYVPKYHMSDDQVDYFSKKKNNKSARRSQSNRKTIKRKDTWTSKSAHFADKVEIFEHHFLLESRKFLGEFFAYYLKSYIVVL